MAAEKTASIETKDRLDKLETTNNRKRAEISNKMSFLEFDVVEILGYLRNIEKSIAEFATRFENNEEKVKFLLGKLSEISDKSDKVINDVSAVRTEVELNNICLQWSPLIKLNSAPRSLSFEDENLVTLKSEHVMCAESKNSIAKDDLPGLEMQNGSAFSIPNCGKEHIEISTQDNDVGEQKHDTNYNSQSNSKNASELISLEVELFAEASKFSQGGSLGRNKYAKSELGTNSTPSRRPARAQNLTPNIIKNSTFDTNITNLDTTPINNTESAWNSARPDFSSLNSSRNTFSSSNFVGTLFLSSGQIGLRYNDLWKPNSSSRYS
ncbi:hypothetical protein AX774_g6537 [Zancudomyces culisetae]|uniref:Uncharacterized protein n=1 Tax=Zancudomyces culisetae TaxID=1213189 RepID=A0A1R1PGB5_ZANCU|nr:hypothetical protein AX774_g6537 [Zancudomyces culisetae]|eukprot:OMH80035.1 hypothetical protein AX774_g6537 [Zancudomyces culisetae]